MSRVPTVGHPGERFDHPRRAVATSRAPAGPGGQFAERRHGLSPCRPFGHTTRRLGLREPRQKVVGLSLNPWMGR